MNYKFEAYINENLLDDFRHLSVHEKIIIYALLNFFQSLTINYSGYIGTYLIIGGVDKYGPHLYEVAAHGSTSKLPFCAMGSGTLPAMSVLEASR